MSNEYSITRIIERSEKMMEALFDQWDEEYLELKGLKLEEKS